MKPLTPLEIANREFARSMRGYDPEEVRQFLGHVSDEVYTLQKRIKEMIKSAAAAEPKPESPPASAEMPTEDLEAQRAQIEQEREQMRREAQAEAEELKLAAQQDVAALREDQRSLKLQRDAYIKRFRFLIKSQVELLDVLENETPETADARVETPAQ